MPKKITTKIKRSKGKNQKQSQSIVVNISQGRRSAPKIQKETKGFLPMSPSFQTISPSSDLSKLVGMLIPKLQTQSTLGASIPPPIPTDVPIPIPSTELQSNVKENLLGESVENKVKKTGGEDVSKYNFLPQAEPQAELQEPVLDVIVGKKIRRNSMEDLQQRYYDQTGNFMDITKGYKIKDFKELVEKMERL